MSPKKARPRSGATVTFPKYSQHHSQAVNKKWCLRLLASCNRTQINPNAKFMSETNYANNRAILFRKQ